VNNLLRVVTLSEKDKKTNPRPVSRKKENITSETSSYEYKNAVG